MQSTATPEASPPKPSNVTKTFRLVAILTIVSKLMGFARDVIVAEVFGTGAISDAYNYAYLYTGNVLVLFGGLGGPFHSATVAILSREKGKPDSGQLMAQVLIATVVLLSFIAVMMFIFAPDLVHCQANKLAANKLFIDQTVLQLRWMSPLIVISGIIGIIYGILNVYERIFWPSLSPLIASISIIIGVTVFVNPHHPDALPLSLATMVGAFGQLLVQMPDLFKCRLSWRISLTPNPVLKEFLIMLGPACIGTLVGQLTTYVDSFFTGQMNAAGDWTAIITANRLVQLPLGILATAMLVPMLPRFSALAQENDNAGIKLDYKKAFQFLIFLSMPLAALLTALPEPIVTVLFKRGNFTAESVNLTGEALWWLAPSIMCYLGRDLITRVFYAFKDSKTPFLVAGIAIAVKYILDWFFISICHWSVGGISLATSAITVLNLSLLTYFLRKKIGRLGTSTMLKPVAIMLIGGIVCGALSAFTFLAWDKYCSFELLTNKTNGSRTLVINRASRFKFQDYRVRLLWTDEDLELKRLKKIAEKKEEEDTADTKKAGAAGTTGTTSTTATTSTAPTVDGSTGGPAPATLEGSKSNQTTGAAPEVQKKFDLRRLLQTDPTTIVSWLSLATGVALSSALGLGSYFAICLFCKIDELQMLRRRLLKTQ
jgi:putative peptidoglycan lipid II flippase